MAEEYKYYNDGANDDDVIGQPTQFHDGQDFINIDDHPPLTLTTGKSHDNFDSSTNQNH